MLKIKYLYNDNLIKAYSVKRKRIKITDIFKKPINDNKTGNIKQQNIKVDVLVKHILLKLLFSLKKDKVSDSNIALKPIENAHDSLPKCLVRKGRPFITE